MEVFEVESKNDKLIITIDKSSVDTAFLSDILKRLRIEQLIIKAEFDEDILELSETIKRDWWAKNKETFLE